MSGARLTRTATLALAFHYAQLEATAFREEFDPASFEDHTLPKNDTIHKKAGPLIKEWMKRLKDDKSADAVIVQSGSKRKPVSPALYHYSDRDSERELGGSRLWSNCDIVQDVSVSEAEVRSRYETNNLMQVRSCAESRALT